MAKVRTDVARGSGGHLVRLMNEALDRLATPEVRDRIVRTALARAQIDEVPDEAASFGSFACGPLRDAIEGVLGEDEASAVIVDLGPAFAHEGTPGSSGVRRRGGAGWSPPRREDAPIVLVASERRAEIAAIGARLKDRVTLIAAHDVFALLAAANRQARQPICVLLDDRMAGMTPSTLATLARVLPAGSRIIVWGGADVHPEVRDATPPIEWFRVGSVEEPDAIADVCIAFLPDDDEEALVARRPAPKVVLAHDDPAWLAAMADRLILAGYEPLTAPDGLMALERCLDQTPSAIVAGLVMNTVDGAQLAALLRSRFGDGGPPVVLVAQPPLPDLPEGVVAMVREDASDDLMSELSAWVGQAG